MDKLYHVTLYVNGGAFGDELEEKIFHNVVSMKVDEDKWLVITEANGNEHGCHHHSVVRYTKQVVQQ